MDLFQMISEYARLQLPFTGAAVTPENRERNCQSGPQFGARLLIKRSAKSSNDVIEIRSQ
jgi:hypothetical protein